MRGPILRQKRQRFLAIIAALNVVVLGALPNRGSGQEPLNLALSAQASSSAISSPERWRETATKRERRRPRRAHGGFRRRLIPRPGSI